MTTKPGPFFYGVVIILALINTLDMKTAIDAYAMMTVPIFFMNILIQTTIMYVFMNSMYIVIASDTTLRLPIRAIFILTIMMIAALEFSVRTTPHLSTVLQNAPAELFDWLLTPTLTAHIFMAELAFGVLLLVLFIIGFINWTKMFGQEF